MFFSADTSHLLIVDMQERLVPVMDQPDAVVGGCIQLVRGANTLGIPVLVSQQYPAGIGATVDTIKNELSAESQVFDKISFSCLRDKNISQYVKRAVSEGRKQWVIAGIETHVCVLQTALDLKNDGHDVAVVVDAVSSRTQQSKNTALSRLAQAGIPAVTVEMILFEWLEKAGTAEFKAISKLIK